MLPFEENNVFVQRARAIRVILLHCPSYYAPLAALDFHISERAVECLHQAVASRVSDPSALRTYPNHRRSRPQQM